MSDPQPGEVGQSSAGTVGSPIVGTVIVLGVLLLALGAILFGNLWGVTARLRNAQARFYSGPLWAYRSIGLFGIVGGVVIIARAVG
jgi:hypothetical protein